MFLCSKRVQYHDRRDLAPLWYQVTPPVYHVTDVILFPGLSPEVNHVCLIAEMTCDFSFTRKHSLSRPIRFDVMSNLVLHVYN